MKEMDNINIMRIVVLAIKIEKEKHNITNVELMHITMDLM